MAETESRSERPKKSETPQQDTQVTRIVTTGNTVRIETPAGKNRRKPRISVIGNTLDTTDEAVTGFLDFLREYAVIGLVIGFVIGGQVQILVKQIVSSFIDPLTQLLFGKALSTRTFALHFHGRIAYFGWGALVYSLVIFLLVLITMYVVIKSLHLDQLAKEAKKKEEEAHRANKHSHDKHGGLES
jgi:large-conductance mechanosensitive channel